MSGGSCALSVIPAASGQPGRPELGADTGALRGCPARPPGHPFLEGPSRSGAQLLDTRPSTSDTRRSISDARRSTLDLRHSTSTTQHSPLNTSANSTMRCALPPACSMHPPVRIMHSSPRRLVLHARGLSCLRPTFPYLATAARRSLATSAVRGEVAPHGAGGKAPPPRHTAHPGWDRRQSDDEDSAHENSLKTFFNSSGFETAAGASAGVLLLGLAAMGYNKWYKSQVLRKMDKAFEGTATELSARSEGACHARDIHRNR